MAMAACGISTPQAVAKAEETFEIYSKTELGVPATPSLGAPFTGNADLFDVTGRQIGAATGECVVTHVSDVPVTFTSHCDVIFRFDSVGRQRGEIHTSTVMTLTTGLPNVINYAVTGGTGDFRNTTGDAIGTLQKPLVGLLPAEFKFTFRLNQTS
ncbi:hypothetical protein [Streptomyces sp. YIM 121038]|uniref:allene oxide cyclase barrel-like domain-containing protein n=1 Tax=Streptomyces sp. YIM 121038 TaxID=2136401 RepID=UPI00111089BE|nr:hypothetical protein [Streptomyces sp. YIM 121038]